MSLRDICHLDQRPNRKPLQQEGSKLSVLSQLTGCLKGLSWTGMSRAEVLDEPPARAAGHRRGTQ